MPAKDLAGDRVRDGAGADARRAEPADADFATWAAPDGWAYRTLIWLPAPGVEPRGSMIFAGGRGDFIEKNLEPIGHMRARGWRMTAFDWRGQGGSRGTIQGGHLDSFDPLVDDLAALVAGWIRDNPGPHVVIGHSMGGHILLRLLAERHPALDAAVLVAPMVRINVAPLPRRLAAVIAWLMTAIGLGSRPAWRQPATPWPAGSKRQKYLTGSPERYLDEIWWWKQQPGFNLGAPSWGWLKAAFASSDALTLERLRTVAVPTLFLGTDRDRLVSPAAIRAAAALVPGAELEMFAESGHEILREADPVRLRALARIDAFLDAHAR
jgi:lysophospholipase